MSRLGDITAALVFSCALVLPALQGVSSVFPKRKLRGVEKTTERPVFGLSELSSGSYQAQLERYIGENFPFRGYLVRINNQINYSLFDEISSSYHSKIVSGKKKFLYEKAYIDAYNGRVKLSKEQIAHKADEIATFQKKLRAKGIAFLLLISPSKARLYPEYIHQRYLSPKESGSNYGRFISAFRKRDVEFFDSFAYLEGRKRETGGERCSSPPPERTGTTSQPARSHGRC